MLEQDKQQQINHQSIDQHFMNIAAELAFMYLGDTAPNPSVAALLIKNNKIIGCGVHLGVGTEHAEVMAIANCQGDPRGSKLIVTLEPCNHTGRRGPCTEALLHAGITEVIYGYKDPNTTVAGGGHEYLSAHGIQISLLKTKLVDGLYQAYDYWCVNSSPALTLKVAMDPNGHIADEHGGSISITSSVMNNRVHHWRGFHDAILTTDVTINRDNPRMNVRLDSGVIAKDIIILAPFAEIEDNRHIERTSKATHVIVGESYLHSDSADKLKNLGFHLYGCRLNQRQLFSWPDILTIVGKLGFHNVWVEVGRQTTTNLITSGIPLHLLFLVGLKTHAESSYHLKDICWDHGLYANLNSYTLAEGEVIFSIRQNNWHWAISTREKKCLQDLLEH